MKPETSMYEIYFFHAIFEVWAGPEMLNKYSEYEIVVLKEDQSVVRAFEVWVHKKDRGIIRLEGKEGISVLTYADFSTDSILHSEIPPELNM